ncbi:unnamed protein product [Linum trigynum]|uniref:Uncharacterized protein n=1 Tax=Linum trigynum TaxID=586398 RepID=A0AAV2FB55_9ROSI
MEPSRRKVIGSSSSLNKVETADLLIKLLFACRRRPIQSFCKGRNSVIFAPYFSRRLASHHRSLFAAANEFEKPVLMLPVKILAAEGGSVVAIS